MQNPILKAIFDANPRRNPDERNVLRRIVKLNEETGEVSEAYLGATSEANLKGKTWDDVIEELADTIIVAADIVFTDFQGEDLMPDQLEERLTDMIRHKLTVWESKQQRQELKVGFREDTT